MVNHPLEFNGISFYQSSYGAVPGEAVLKITKKGEQLVKRAHQGERFVIDGGKAQVEILRIEGNLMRMGPAVKVGITAGDRAVSFWVFKFIDAIEEQVVSADLVIGGVLIPGAAALEKFNATLR